MPAHAAVVSTYHAATFAERGVHAPFTSESLSGARFRRVLQSTPGSSPSLNLEMVIPNPSGGRGVYIVGWSEIRDLFRPTLHDIRLGEAVRQMLREGGELSPAGVRTVARKVAKEGLAGRAGAGAARAAETREQARVAAAKGLIVQRLGQALGLAGAASGTDVGGRATLTALGARFGRQPAPLAAAVQRLARLFADQGIGPDSKDAPVSCLMQGMRRLVDTGATMAQRAPDPAPDPLAVFRIAETMLRLAGHPRAALVTRAEDIVELVTATAESPAATIALYERSDWLLDGWQRICLLWQTADAFQARSSTPAEMASLVPVLPDEADEWFGLPPGSAAKIAMLRKADAPRTTNAFALDAVARNEHLRTLAA